MIEQKAVARVVLGQDRFRGSAFAAGVRRPPRRALEARPAVVRRQPKVDLLEGGIADVGQHELPRGAIEREAPGVAQAAGHDLRQRRRRVEPDQLAQQRIRVLGVGTVGGVAGRQPQLPVGTELELAAVVVAGLVVADREQQPAARRVRDVRGWPSAVLAHLQLAGRRGRRRVRARGQIDVEAAGAGVIRREGDRQQPALGGVVERDRGEIEERPAAQPLHAPRALGDVDAPRVTRGGGGVGRTREVAGLLQPRRALSGRREQQQAGEDQWSLRDRRVRAVAHDAPPTRPTPRSSCTRHSPRAGTRWPPSPSARRRGSRRPPACRGGSSAPARSNVMNSLSNTATKDLGSVPFPIDVSQAAPPTFSRNPPYRIFFASEPDLQLPRTYEWNIAIERALGTHQTFASSYVGAGGWFMGAGGLEQCSF